MAKSRAIGGVAYVKVNGKQYMLRGSGQADLGEFDREGQAGQDTVHGFTVKPKVPSISGEFTVTEDTDLNEIHAMDDGTVTMEFVTGKTAVLVNAWSATAPVLDAAEGKVPLKWEGRRAYWM